MTGTSISGRTSRTEAGLGRGLFLLRQQRGLPPATTAGAPSARATSTSSSRPRRCKGMTIRFTSTISATCRAISTAASSRRTDFPAASSPARNTARASPARSTARASAGRSEGDLASRFPFASLPPIREPGWRWETAMRVRLAALSAFALAAACTSVDPAPPVASGPSEFTKTVHADFLAQRNFADTRDFEFAQRGFVATRKDPLITNAAGQPVWDLAAFDFLKGRRARHRQPQPVAPGPADGEARPLQGHRPHLAGARLRPRQHHLRQGRHRLDRHRHAWAPPRPPRPRSTSSPRSSARGRSSRSIYTHSHTDHFGGAGGLVKLGRRRRRQGAGDRAQGLPRGAVGENIIAGPAMQRRAIYQFGVPLPKGADGHGQLRHRPRPVVGHRLSDPADAGDRGDRREAHHRRRASSPSSSRPGPRRRPR